MGAAGSLELAGNLPAFYDHLVHPCANLDQLDPDCVLPSIVDKEPIKKEKLDYILNNSFGFFGINVVLIVKRFKHDPVQLN